MRTKIYLNMKNNIKLYFEWLFRSKKSFIWSKPTFKGYRYMKQNIESINDSIQKKRKLNQDIHNIVQELGISDADLNMYAFTRKPDSLKTEELHRRIELLNKKG